MQSTFLTRLRAWFAQGNRTAWTVFFLFLFCLLFKTVIFHYSAFGYVHRWEARIAPVLLLAAVSFLTRRKYWTIFANLLLDCWLIANLIYYKANGIFFSFDMMFMLDNMSGFWLSIRPFLTWSVFSFPIITLLYVVLMSCFQLWKSPSNRLYILAIIVMLLSGIMLMHNNKRINIGYGCEEAKYFTYHVFNKKLLWENTGNLYVRNQSIISWLPAMLTFQLIQQLDGDRKTFTDADIRQVHNLMRHGKTDMPSKNLILILVESLESWALQPVVGYSYTPHLAQLRAANHVLSCGYICSQIKYGVSADGQMLVVSGMLPIDAGATCRLFGTNEYPSYASLYPVSAIMNPSIGTWEQATMTKSYRFQQLMEPKADESWGDKEVINHLMNWCLQQDTTFCALGITVTSHVPFLFGKEHVIYRSDDMPEIMSSYLNCLHYTDSCIGAVVDMVMNSPLAENTTIVITGDHTIFQTESAYSELNTYANANNIDFYTGHNFTPLIIYSPEIEGNIQVTDTCYQMDIFPTILHLIGAEDYYWHGFGVNLLDSAARNNRPCTEQEAYRLSDLMIRSDYFRTYMGIGE